MAQSRTDAVFANDIYLPTQLYRACCTKAELALSKKGKPMVTLTCEITEPEVIESPDGKSIRITGQTFQLYLVLVPYLVGKQRESSMAQVWKFCDKLGVTPLLEVDAEGQPLFPDDVKSQKDKSEIQRLFRGLEFDIELSSREKIKRARPTPAQQSAGIPGEVLLDGQGAPLTEGWQIEADLKSIDNNDPRPSRRESIAEVPAN